MYRLLVLLRKELQAKPLEYGLCRLVSDLRRKELITSKERVLLIEYIYAYPPKNANPVLAYWYKCGLKAPRFKWLNVHIDMLKPMPLTEEQIQALRDKAKVYRDKGNDYLEPQST